jgi:hypothetical protein
MGAAFTAGLDELDPTAVDHLVVRRRLTAPAEPR